VTLDKIFHVQARQLVFKVATAAAPEPALAAVSG